jgi:serine protease
MNYKLLPSLLACFLFVDGAPAQAPLKARADVVKPAKTKIDRTKHDAERVSVKFRDDLPVRLRERKLADMGANAQTLRVAAPLLQRLEANGAIWERLHMVSEEKLGEMRQRAQRKTGKAMPDLNTTYILSLPKHMNAEQIIDELNALDVIELAEPMALPAPPPAVGVYQPQQDYLEAAPAGVDAEYAWTQFAGQGGNVRIADIEYTWNLNHTDLSATLLGPTPVAPVIGGVMQTNDHGTAVLGIMGGLNNGVGVTGIAYNSTFFVASSNTTAGYNIAGAITTAIASLRDGDILLLEAQTDGPGAGTTDWVPIEWESQAVYNAIVTAVGDGIIVVEAAGNGSQNLDDPMFNARHAPFLAANDSGAIIVGAGGVAAGGGERARVDFSSFGSTVDLQGWGEFVVTTGYGDLVPEGAPPESDPNQFYTSFFNGTSSASPVVAGACALMQSHHKISNSGAALSPSQMRAILRGSGSPQVDGFKNLGGTFSQTGMTVTRQSGAGMFSSFDINSFIRFSSGQQARITAFVSATQVTVETSQNVAATSITLQRPATQNIGPRPNLRAAMQFISGPRVWVDFSWPGLFEFGNFHFPYNSMPEGVSEVPVNGRLLFKASSSAWTGTINKGMTLHSLGGATTIGL